MAARFSAILALFASPARAEPCCATCTPGTAKFYSVPEPSRVGAECGECCLRPALFRFWRLFEPPLAPGGCAARDFTVYVSTETDGVPPFAITNDRYRRPATAPVV